MPDTFEEAVKRPEINVVPTDRTRRRGRSLILAACLMATFVTATESTIVATAMPTIVGDLGGFDLFSWVFTIFLLAQAVSIPIYGRLADMFGRKKVFFIGIGLFLTGSILCGFAWSMVPLICFRAIQGLGAGAIQPITTTILGDIRASPCPGPDLQRIRRFCGCWSLSRCIPDCAGLLVIGVLGWGTHCRDFGDDDRRVPARNRRTTAALDRLAWRTPDVAYRRQPDAGAGAGRSSDVGPVRFSADRRHHISRTARVARTVYP
jgi:hypothetical protein